MKINNMRQGKTNANFCVACGNALSIGARFCNQCGIEVEARDETRTSIDRRKIKIIVLILVGVLIGSGIITLINQEPKMKTMVQETYYDGEKLSEIEMGYERDGVRIKSLSGDVDDGYIRIDFEWKNDWFGGSAEATVSDYTVEGIDVDEEDLEILEDIEIEVEFDWNRNVTEMVMSGQGIDVLDAEYEYENGKVVKSISESLGITTITEYNEHGDVVKLVQKRDGQVISKIKYEYEYRFGKIEECTKYDKLNDTEEEIEYIYKANKLVKIENEDGSYTEIEYENWGKTKIITMYNDEEDIIGRTIYTYY